MSVCVCVVSRSLLDAGLNVSITGILRGGYNQPGSHGGFVIR